MGHSCTMRVIEVWYGSFMYYEGHRGLVWVIHVLWGTWRFGMGHSCTMRVMQVWYGSFMYYEGHGGLVWVIHVL
jgi:hypothetical protein